MVDRAYAWDLYELDAEVSVVHREVLQLTSPVRHFVIRCRYVHVFTQRTCRQIFENERFTILRGYNGRV